MISKLWKTPALRYSNALEGIFHEQTIICEDDSDCRLINSVADHVSTQEQKQWKDTAYVPTGGKHGIPKIATVLRKIGVPVKAVFDMDFLSEKNLVESTVEAFGGQWIDIEPDWKRLDSAVREGKTPKSILEIKNDIISLLQEADPDALPSGDVKEALKQGKAWYAVKQFGHVAIPSGNAQGYYESVRKKLEAIGIFLVPVGELEGFCRRISGHGPKFVTGLLSDVPLGSDELNELRTFVKHVHTYEVQ